MDERVLIHAVVIGGLILLFSPIIVLSVYSSRRKWPFRRVGIYVQVYFYVVAFMIYWLAGVRGWMLIAGMGVTLALGLFTYYAYVYLLDVFRPTIKHRNGGNGGQRVGRDDAQR